jgi:hypothetical protein
MASASAGNEPASLARNTVRPIGKRVLRYATKKGLKPPFVVVKYKTDVTAKNLRFYS